MKLPSGSCYPEGNFGGNQLLDGSISLSPLYPKFDDRFARQNRYELPPEFPLASPYSGIVHHLSGRNRHALTRIPSQVNRIGRRWAPVRGSRLAPASRRFTFIAPQGFSSHPKTRAHVALLGPCFKTGQMKPPTANSLKRSRDACAGRRETSLSHYRSSPRGRPLARRRLSCHEGLRRWVERPSPRSPTRSERQAVRS